jgi:hypothetical protein
MPTRSGRTFRLRSPPPPRRSQSLTPTVTPPVSLHASFTSEPSFYESVSENSLDSLSSAGFSSPSSSTLTMADDENTFNASEASGMIPSFSGKEGSFWKFIQMADEAFEDVTSETDKKSFIG